MAIKVAIASGNFNTAGTWYTGTETGTGSSNGAGLGAARYTAVFTAPNTTNACLGMIVSMYSIEPVSVSTITAQLQEYDGAAWNDCAGASATVNEADLIPYTFFSGSNATAMFLLFKFATPYVYTTTTAGYYRIKVSRAVNDSSTAFYATTVTLEPWAVVIDNRTGAIGSTDTAYVVGTLGAKTTVTLDGACACGPTVAVDGTDYSTIVPSQSANWSLCIGYMGQVIPDATQDTTLTINGSSPIIVAQGQLNFGTAASPHTAYKAKIQFTPKTTYASGIRVYGYNTAVEHFTMVGQTKTFKTLYASGAGTAVSPLVVDTATNWAVGDLLGFSADTYSKYEFKYIRTIAGTSITLADSVGGAESALANTHYAADWVLNLSRTVGMSCSAANQQWFGYLYCTSTTAVAMKYAEFSDIGGNASSRFTLFASQNTRHAVNVEGCAFYEIRSSFVSSAQPIYYAYESAIADNKYKDNVHFISYSPNPYTTSGARLSFKNNSASLVTNNYHIGGRYAGFELYGYGSNFDNFHVRNASTSYAGSASYGAIMFLSSANVTATNCTVNASRSNAFIVNSGVNNLRLKNCSAGTVYANATNGDFSLYNLGSYSTAVIDSCNLSATGGWYYYVVDANGYMYNAPGSQYAFQNYDNVAGDHRIYKPDGVIQRTAAGLTDTTVRTTGGSCLRFESNNTINNLVWEQYVPVGNVLAQTMTVGVWVNINSATYYAGTHQMPRITVDYDNGTTAYAEAAQIAGSWQFLSIPITATTSYPQFKVTLSTNTDATTTDAYVYFTDFAVLYPAGYQLKLGELAYFADGEPIKPTIATNLSAADVWAVQTSGLTGTGTIGKFVTKLLTVAKFLGLK
ncbi:MAG TPA: hypothetical protein PK367_01870 [Candidatus Paceibacterota bacterium]|nr:hypothetical protein [Candidatus Paceibacterota bacterium]